MERNCFYRSQVRGDIFADFSVAACGTLHKQSVAIMQNDRQAIDLWLDNEPGSFDAVIDADDTFKPTTCIVSAKGIRQRENRCGVADLVETVCRLGARAQRWRV